MPAAEILWAAGETLGIPNSTHTSHTCQLLLASCIHNGPAYCPWSSSSLTMMSKLYMVVAIAAVAAVSAPGTPMPVGLNLKLSPASDMLFHFFFAVFDGPRDLMCLLCLRLDGPCCTCMEFRVSYTKYSRF